MRELIDLLSLVNNVRVLGWKDKGDCIEIYVAVYGKPVTVTIRGEGLNNARWIWSQIVKYGRV